MDKTTRDREIDKAIGAHRIWKLKLRRALRARTLPSPVCDVCCDYNCDFGKWLLRIRREGEPIDNPHYLRVRATHAAFHREAGRIAALAEAGDFRRACAELDGPAYVSATMALTRSMNAWRDAA